MSIVLVGSTSGSCTLQEQAVAGNTVLTLPTTSGTILTTATPFSNGQGPSFRAKMAVGSTSISSGVFTKIALTSEDWDTANCFDSTTNYRFTPNVAGYYQINGNINFAGTVTRALVSIYKNGSQYSRQTDLNFSTSNIYLCVSDMVYMNGTTDYLELWGYVQGSGLTINSPATGEQPNMSAFLARAA